MKLIGYQFADAGGTNIQGDDACPFDLMSFEVMTPAAALAAMEALATDGQATGFLLQPILEDTVQEPTIVDVDETLASYRPAVAIVA